MGENSGYIILAFFLVGVVALVIGFALYYGELELMKASATALPPDLPWRISWPAFLIGGIFIVIGFLFAIFDP
jgi:predicted lysophospholipase L1 biosynthesis ABC-type transport system permease subunit